MRLLTLCAFAFFLSLINVALIVTYVQVNYRKFHQFGAQRLQETTNTTLDTTTNLSLTTTLQIRELCPEKSDFLTGFVGVNMTKAEDYFWAESGATPSAENSVFLGLPHMIKELFVAGRNDLFFEPSNCVPNQTVAIIIPFRDRESHLRILLGHLVPILRKQGIRFSIFVVEQRGDDTFNKGRLMNTGFEYAAAMGRRHQTPFNCFVFHDVDLIPERDDVIYKCSGGRHVDHLSPAIDKFEYKFCCGITVGGVVAFTEQQFRKFNGYPNSYWGWGAEDDDMYRRIISFKKFEIKRPDAEIGRYTMIKHTRDQRNPTNHDRMKKLNNAMNTAKRDGLSDLSTDIVSVQIYPLFIKLLVDVGKGK